MNLENPSLKKTMSKNLLKYFKRNNLHKMKFTVPSEWMRRLKAIKMKRDWKFIKMNYSSTSQI